MCAALMTNSKNYNTGNKHYNNQFRHSDGARKASAYCKVCHDAGRPRHEYTSHFVKDKKGPDGKVVCPLLLNQECRYCHEKGHTPKECPKIKDKAERKRVFEQRRRDFRACPDANGFCTAEGQRHTGSYREPAPNTRVRLPPLNLASILQPSTNTFATLRESSSDEEVTTANKLVFPALSNKPERAVVAPTQPKLTGWAAVAAKPASHKRLHRQVQKTPAITCDARDNESECTDTSEDEEEERDQCRSMWKLERERMKGMSWAEMCDSDIEEEEL